MKFSLSWLKKHLDTNASVSAITDALVSLGLEVESVANPLQNIKNFVVGHVIKTERHPNADRLNVCVVQDGTADENGDPHVFQVVCGAPNVPAGLKVAFAKPGTVMPNTGLPLKKGVIRGVESQGMLCSNGELLIGEESDGIMELPLDAEVGMDLSTFFSTSAVYASFVDPIFDVSITPNRSDCFSLHGIARDLAAKGLGELVPLPTPTFEAKGSSPLSLLVEDQHCVPHFALRLIKGVKNKPSPQWVQNHLKSAGLKPISALVDVTNLMCLAYGRPMHVFDAHKVSGKFCVGFAKNEDSFLARNEKIYTLDDTMLVVKDEQSNHVLALAGIMGGQDSAVEQDTADVILESALFDAITIALAGQKTNIISDSRTRFERGVDPKDVLPLLDIATQYILEWCGGEAYDITEVHNSNLQTAVAKPITLTLEKFNRLTGYNTTLETIKQSLQTLYFNIIDCSDVDVTVTAPTFRPDITLDVDLIEEVLRLMGFDALTPTPLPLLLPKPVPSARARLSRYVTSQGYNEVYTWSFTSASTAALFGQGVPLKKPLSADMAVMRPSVFSGLLKIASQAQKRSQPNVMYFEFGNQYHTQTSLENPIKEMATLTLLRVFSKTKRHWQNIPPAVDVFTLKSEVLAMLSLLGINAVQIEPAGPSYYHPGRVACVKQGKIILGYFGQLHPKVIQTLDVEGLVLGAELFLQPLTAIPQKTKQPQAFTPAIYQSITRDLAFWVDTAVPCEKIINLIQKVDRHLITAVDVFDVYSGDKAPQGQKSIALEITLQPTQGTMSLEEVSLLQERIAQSVQAGCGGQLRDS